MARVFLHWLNAAWRRWAGGKQRACLEFSRLFRRNQLLRMALDNNKTSISVHVWDVWAGKQK